MECSLLSITSWVGMGNGGEYVQQRKFCLLIPFEAHAHLHRAASGDSMWDGYSNSVFMFIKSNRSRLGELIL